jgi:hypothetical protein
MEEILIISKGGTMDVGIHTGTTKPNTVLFILDALLSFISFEKTLIKKIFLSFICNLLYIEIC